MNEKELFKQAAAKAEKINKTCKDYELARTSLETLQQDNAVLHIIVESIDKAEEKRFTLASLPRSSELAIIDHLKSIYTQRIAKCKEIVSEYVPAEKEPEKPRTIMTVADSYANAIKRRAAEEKNEQIKAVEDYRKTLMEKLEAKPIVEETPSTAAEEDHEKKWKAVKEMTKVPNERIKQLLNEGLRPTDIAKVTGMTPNAVTHRIQYMKDKENREQGVEKPDPTPRVLSKDIISDTELDEQYFKHGKTVKEIAQKYGIKPDGLYKRIEAMKAKRQDIAKECVSSQQ